MNKPVTFVRTLTQRGDSWQSPPIIEGGGETNPMRLFISADLGMNYLRYQVFRDGTLVFERIRCSGGQWIEPGVMS